MECEEMEWEGSVRCSPYCWHRHNTCGQSASQSDSQTASQQVGQPDSHPPGQGCHTQLVLLAVRAAVSYERGTPEGATKEGLFLIPTS